MRLAFVLSCSVALLGTVGTASAQDWTKSKWGPNDEIGAANYMTPELVVKAASLVKTGKTYPLGIPVDTTTPAYPPRAFKITIVQPGQAGIPGLGPSKTTYNDDIIEGWVGVGSQLDGLGHIGVEHVYYNGNKLLEFADPTGLKKLGVEKIPPMVTRGVLLDMAESVNLAANTDPALDDVVIVGRFARTETRGARLAGLHHGDLEGAWRVGGHLGVDGEAERVGLAGLHELRGFDDKLGRHVVGGADLVVRSPFRFRPVLSACRSDRTQ